MSVGSGNSAQLPPERLAERPWGPPGAFEASELLPDGLVSARGPHGVVVAMNAPAERITGLTRSAVIGRPLAEALDLRDRSGERWWSVASPWEGLATRTGHRERLLLLPGGREVLVTSRYLRRERLGPVTAVLVGLRDAEARRRLELDHAALISTVAHELRSPLTGVKGFAATLLRRWDRFTDEQKRLMIETIDADAERLTRLIAELLDVSRIDSGRLRVHRVPLDIRAVFERHVERQVGAGRAREAFDVSVDDAVGELCADPDRLDQILTNLIDNALRHGASRVWLRAEPAPDGAVALRVMDDGPGVPADKRVMVFQRFWHGQTHGSTGLGLYIVRGLVELHGGSVSIETAPMGGAELRVVLPAGEPS